MTTDRDIVPLVRSWLHDDPDGSAERVLDAALAIVDATPQRPAARWPARRPTMHTIVRMGVAAAVLAMAVALGYSLLQNIGDHEPPPGPDVTDDASPPTTPASGDLPPGLRHIFIGATRDVPGIEVGDRLVLDFTARVFRLHTGIGRSALLSAAHAEGDLLRLETVVGSTECVEGDVGTYSYALSPGGTALTVASGDDDCAPRAEALVGEWRRSACLDSGNWCLGEMEAGTQHSLFFDPFAVEWGQPVTRYGAMTYEIPAGWANADDRTHFYTLMRADVYDEAGAFNCIDCPDGIWIGANPQAVQLGCGEEPDSAIGGSVEALAGWIRAHPGLRFSEGPALAIDGRQTIVVDITGAEDYPDVCADPELDRSFVPLFTHPGYTYGIGTGDHHRLMLVEITTDRAMLIGIDTLDPAGIDAFLDEVQPILDSIRLAAP